MAQALSGWGSGLDQYGADVRTELEPAWQRAHAELVRLAKHRAGLDDEEGNPQVSASAAGVF
ncbi:MAG TPA: hypothetical protein VGK73_25500, partial [Polyangiaceae bacterium]